VGQATPGSADVYAWHRTIPLVAGEDVELDVEGLAVAGDAVYAIGSHSATRRSADDPTRTHARNRERLRETEARPERDKVFRFTFDSRTGRNGVVAAISLRQAISAHPELGPFARLASKENGVDIEGLAADGTSLFAGFRGPVLRHGLVPVLRFTFDSPDQGEVSFVMLDGRGIRDLARVGDGFLVLAGPPGDSDQPHRFYWWNGRDCTPGRAGPGGRVRFLGEVPSPDGGKSEALSLLGETTTDYDVAVFYDGIPANTTVAADRPRRLRLPKQAAGRAETPATRLCGQSG
jgi:hypothetical protein